MNQDENPEPQYRERIRTAGITAKVPCRELREEKAAKPRRFPGIVPINLTLKTNREKRGRMTECWLSFALTLVLVLLTARSALADSRPELAWTTPAQVRRTTWTPEGDMPAPVPAGDPAKPTQLQGDQLLLVPAVGGDIVRFAGERVRVGIGSGFGSNLDAIVWLHDEVLDTGSDVRLPTWGTPRFFVAMAKPGQSGWVQLWLAARHEDPMLWYRLDEAVARWIRDPALAPPIAPYPAENANPIIHWLGEARRVVSTPDCSSMLNDYLLARWLGDSAQTRPLQRPFFLPVSLSVEGGRAGQVPRAATDVASSQHRFVVAGERMRILASNADVLSVAVRVRSVGRTVLKLFENESLAQELAFVTPLQAFDEKRWSPARLVRLIVPDTGALSVAVDRGEASISVKGYRQQSSVIDFSGIHSRKEHLVQATRAACIGADRRLLGAIVSAEALKTESAIREVVSLANDETLAPSQRTLLLHEALRLGPSFDDIRPWVSKLWKHSAPTNARTRTVMRRSALEAVTFARNPQLDGLELPLDDGKQDQGVPRDERLALSALIEAASRPKAQTRVQAAENAERFAAASSLQNRWMDLARDTWRRAAPWSNLKPAATLSTVVRYVPVEPDEPGNPTCAVSGSTGTRWLKFEREQVLKVGARGGSHTLVSFVGDPSAEPADVTVMIDGTSVVVHSGAGLHATAAVKPGERSFTGSGLTGLLARIPTDAKLPCSRLREGVRWAVVRNEGVFSLPLGTAMTVASIMVSDAWLEEPTKVSIGVGGAVYEGWVRRKATGAMEVPVPPGVTHISVQTDTPQLVRVRARLSPAPRGRSPPEEEAAAEELPSKEEMIERVRAATQALRQTETAEAAAKARVERIKWLELLGYRSYAAADRARLPSGMSAPEASQSRMWDHAANLPPGSATVELVGSLPRIVELPAPKSREVANELVSLVKAREKGEPKEAVFNKLVALAGRSSSVDALLLGVLAQENGDIETAAAAFERIGRRHGSGVALGRAARLRADLAYARGKAEGSLAAYILAREAFDTDGSGTDTLNRLSEAIDWQDVRPEKSAGEVYVYARQGVRQVSSTGSKVRRALLDPPDGAAVTEAQPISAIVTRFEHSIAKVEAGCHALDGILERCPIEVQVDGKGTECLSKEEWDVRRDGHHRGSVANSSSPRPGQRASRTQLAAFVAKTETCFVELPKGAKRLRVVPPPNRRAMLWAAISSVSSPEASTEAPAESMVKWFEVNHTRSLRIVVVCPAVLRVSAIGLAGETQTLNLRVKKLDGRARSERRDLNFTGQAGGREFFYPSREPLTEPKSELVAIHRSGRHEITLRTDRGRAWVRLAMASPVGLPRTVVSKEPPSIQAQELAPSQELPGSFPYRVGWENPAFPLSVSGDVRYSYEALTQEDDTPRDDNQQVSVSIRRAFPSLHLWLRETSLVRFREGPDTLGARVNVSRAPVDDLPGIDLAGRVAYQSFDSTPALGWLASASLHKPFGLRVNASTDPELTMTYRHVDFDANHESGADGEVFSLYSARRPRSLDITVPVYHRPWVDMLNSYSLGARTLPDFDGFDSVEAAVQTRAVAGDGYAPLLRLRVVASYRLQSTLRREAFLRTSIAPSVLFWHWLSPMGRITLQADLSYFVDSPESAGTGSQVEGFLALGFDAVGGRGLADFTPSEKPFTERMEEGAEPSDRDQRGVTPYWESDR